MLMTKRSHESEIGSQYQELKERLHQRVIEVLDMNVIATMSQDLVTMQLSRLIEQLLQEEPIPLNQRERTQITQGVIHEVLGLGPLEPLLADASVNDILVNGHKQVYVERSGKLELTAVRFKDDAHLKKIIEKCFSRLGRRIDDA